MIVRVHKLHFKIQTNELKTMAIKYWIYTFNRKLYKELFIWEYKWMYNAKYPLLVAEKSD